MRSRPESASAPTEVLAAMVERVTFHNADTGFCVLRLKARGHRELITATGHAPVINAGEFVQLSGTWINDRTHGLQFRAAFLKASPPTTLAGIERYLGSGMIRGIGPVFAKALVRTFGEQVFEVIETEPHRLREVAGVGPVRAKRIITGWADQKVIREIMLFLHSNGVGASQGGANLQDLWRGRRSADQREPLPSSARHPRHRLSDRRPDRLQARHREGGHDPGTGGDQLRPRRGHGPRPLRTARRTAHRTSPASCWRSPTALIDTALGLELASEAVIADDLDGARGIFLASLYQAERTIAARLLAISKGVTPWSEIAADRAIPWVEQKTDRVLAESQRAAVAMAVASKLLVITGGPGVGKTTLVNAILKILRRPQRLGPAVCADRARSQTPGGEHRAGGQDHPSTAGDQPLHRRVQARPNQSARMRAPCGG